jgi:hypothetical protein
VKAKPMKQDGRVYWPCEPHEATHIRLHMPGPFPNRILPVRRAETPTHPSWEWNGSTESPTLWPSLLTHGCDGTVCHSFVRDGQVEFLADCTHEFAGQNVELLDVDGESEGGA